MAQTQTWLTEPELIALRAASMDGDRDASEKMYLQAWRLAFKLTAGLRIYLAEIGAEEDDFDSVMAEAILGAIPRWQPDRAKWSSFAAQDARWKIMRWYNRSGWGPETYPGGGRRSLGVSARAIRHGTVDPADLVEYPDDDYDDGTNRLAYHNGVYGPSPHEILEGIEAAAAALARCQDVETWIGTLPGPSIRVTFKSARRAFDHWCIASGIEPTGTSDQTFATGLRDWKTSDEPVVVYSRYVVRTAVVN